MTPAAHSPLPLTEPTALARDNGAAFSLAGESFVAFASGVLHWPARRAVLVADLHLGKASTMSAGGLPVPADLCVQTARRDLARLSLELSRLDAQHLYILGDLMHARESFQPEVMDEVRRWRCESHDALRITLIRGNHDQRAGDPPADWQMDCADEPFEVAGIALRHIPPRAEGAETDRRPWMAGHLHPMVSLGAGTGERLRSKCFHLTRGGVILPAFGSFTGGARVVPAPGDRVLLCGPVGVIAWNCGA